MDSGLVLQAPEDCEKSTHKTADEVLLDIGMDDNSDAQRSEEAWGQRNEQFCLQWLRGWSKRAELHRQAAAHCASMSHRVVVPSILLPLIMTPLSGFLEREDTNTTFVVPAGFMVCAMLSTVVSYFKFDKLSVEHASKCHKYEDLISDMQVELNKSRRYRRQVDVFITEVKMRSDALDRNGPDL